MTVAEQIIEELHALDERGQRAVLAVVRRLRAEPDVSLDDVDLDDEVAADAWRERLAARTGVKVSESMARFRALGLVDDEGRLLERELPVDMRSTSRTSVAT